MATTVEFPLSNFSIGSTYTVKTNGQVTKAVTTVTKSLSVILPSGAAVEEADLIITASTGAAITELNVAVGSGNRHDISKGENAVPLADDISGTDDYTLSFRFAGWYGGKPAGTYNVSVDLSTIYLSVRYTRGGGGGDEPEEVDRPLRTEAPDDAILLCDGVSRGIMAVLHPLECTVSEEAGGEYELLMKYPTEGEVWKLIQPDTIIRAPVPYQHLDGIEVLNPEYYITSVATTLWKKLPSSYRKKSTVTAQDYSGSTWYVYGDIVKHNGLLYRFCGTEGYAPAPPGYPWAPYSGSPTIERDETVTVPGVKEEELAAEVNLIKIADHNTTYMRVQAEDGKTGYVKIADCRLADSQVGEGSVYYVQPRDIKRQHFRVYGVNLDSRDRVVKINARHISYDLDAMVLKACSLVEASPSLALTFMQGCFFENILDDSTTRDERIIATDITEGTITQDWSWGSPVSALLDPDTGFVDLLKARLYRDDDDFILLTNGGTNPRYTIRYGTNLLGVTVKTDTGDLITRIIPKAKDANGEPFFLPEQYIDSELVETYAVIRYEILEVDAQVGKRIEKTDGTTVTLTEADVRQMMRDEAAKRFTDDWCDQPQVTVNVEFVLLGDSEEYKQYRELQYINLYDIVRVIHSRLGIDINLQVTGYEWDAVLRRYVSITLGNPFEYGRGTIPGYQIGTRAIGERALGPALRTRLDEIEKKAEG